MLVVRRSIDERDLARLEFGVREREAAEEKGGEDCGEREASLAQMKSSAQRWSKKAALLRSDFAPSLKSNQ